MTKLIFAFRSFVNSPKNGISDVDWLCLAPKGNKQKAAVNTVKDFRFA